MEAQALASLQNMGFTAKMDAFSKPDMFNKPIHNYGRSKASKKKLGYNIKFELADPFLHSALESVKDLCSKSKSACLTFVRQDGVAPVVRLLKAVNIDESTVRSALETLNFVLQKLLMSGVDCAFEGSKAFEDLHTCNALPAVLDLLKGATTNTSKQVSPTTLLFVHTQSCAPFT